MQDGQISRVVVHDEFNDGTVNMQPWVDGIVGYAALGVYSTLYPWGKHGGVPSFERLVGDQDEATKHEVQKAVNSLKEHGYLRIVRDRDERNRLTSTSTWHLFPYGAMSEGHRYMTEQNARSEPNPENPYLGNDLGKLQIDDQNLSANGQNPRSFPNPENCGNGGAENEETPGQPLIPNFSGEIGVSPGQPLIPTPAPRARETNQTKPLLEGVVPSGDSKDSPGKARYEKLSRRIEEGSAHVLRNLTEEQFSEVFGLVCGGCASKAHEADQRALCRPLADSMAEGLSFDELRSAVLGVVGDPSCPTKSLPSFWMLDNAGAVRGSALSSRRWREERQADVERMGRLARQFLEAREAGFPESAMV